MRVILTGGGTAGHINPALAIAETILQNAPDSEVIFVGNKKGKEVDLVPREGYQLYFTKSKGIPRKASKLSPKRLHAYWLAATSPYMPRTTNIIKRFKPDLVIGTGGYACWPIMAAATRMGIPTAVHESNSFPGLAIRRLQDEVNMIWINFPSTAERIRAHEKITKVGNPLRRGFGMISYEEAREKLGIAPDQKMILSFAGSLGAAPVSEAVLGMMRDYSSKDTRLLHVHATGKDDYEDMKKLYASYGLQHCQNCTLTDYIYDMPLRMAAADLVISRAGAMTLSELALMRKAAILIPSPNVAENHHYHNAKEFADAGAAILTEEKTLGDGALTDAARAILEDPARAADMKRAIAGFAVTDANRRIWEKICELTQK